MSNPDAPEVATASGDSVPTIDELRVAAEDSSADAAPWADLAYAHFQRGEFSDAAAAYQKAVAIDDDAAVLWSAMGESLVYAEDAASADADPLPASAIAAFEKAVEIDPSDPRARYFLLVQKDLAGDHNGAIDGWLELLAESPAGAPWERDLILTIEQVAKMNDIEVADRLAKANEGRLPPIAVPGSGAVAGLGASDSVGGPTQAQIAAAQSLTAEEQQAQIEGMVAMAEAKLEEDPSNLDRWVMVMRSHSMLGNAAKAKATLEAAVAANPANEAGLREQARALGIQ
ncbi:MAG: tetratricopeptide repeat protein [Erythrobacter sp.]|nr:tetratricopeptide repeat protein [Erythrobacter sp.]